MATFHGYTATIVPNDGDVSLICTTRFDGPLIDGRPEDVWSVLVEYDLATVRAWNPTVARVEFVSDTPKQGTRLALGDLVRVTKEADGIVQPPLYLRVVRLVPPYHLVFLATKSDAAPGGSSGSAAAAAQVSQGLYYIDHSVFDVGGRTRDVYTNYREIRVPADQAEAQAEAQREAVDSLGTYLRHGQELLKELVESRVRAAATAGT